MPDIFDAKIVDYESIQPIPFEVAPTPGITIPKVSGDSAVNRTIGGWKIADRELKSGEGSETAGMNAQSETIWRFFAGSSDPATAPFRVDKNGNTYMNSSVIAGYALSSVGIFGGDGSDGALAVSLGTEASKESYAGTGTDSNIGRTDAGSNIYYREGFVYTASASYSLTKIALSLKKVGSPVGTLSLQVFRLAREVATTTDNEIQNAGVQVGNTATLAESGLTTAYATYDFTAINANIVSGCKYLVVVYSSRGAGNNTDYVLADNGSAGGFRYWKNAALAPTYWAYIATQKMQHTIYGKDNSVALSSNRSYNYTSISVDANCQIIITPGVFAEQPCIIKCQGNCTIAGIINGYGSGVQSITTAGYGFNANVNGVSATSGTGAVAPSEKFGRLIPFAGGFSGAKGGSGFHGVTTAGILGGAGGDGGAFFILEIIGNLIATGGTIDLRGEIGCSGQSQINAPADDTGGGGGGGGGGTAIVVYGGTKTGSFTYAVSGGAAGTSGMQDTASADTGGGGGSGGSSSGLGTAGSNQSSGRGGAGGGGGAGLYIEKEL